jgi:hypothetical protein
MNKISRNLLKIVVFYNDQSQLCLILKEWEI